MKKKLLLVVNSQSGKCQAPKILAEVQSLLTGGGVETVVCLTEFPGHARQMMETMPLEDFTGIGIIGGDGTIHEVINGLLRRSEHDPNTVPDIPLGFIPAGSGNSVSLDCQITSPQVAVERILRGEIRAIDVAHATTATETRYCINIVGWGAAVEINRLAERIRFLGPPRYAIAAIVHILSATGHPLRLRLDDVEWNDDFQMIVACNTQFTGKAMRLAPRADLADGKLDIVLVRRATRLQMWKLFRDVYTARHLDLPCVEYRQVSTLELRSETQDPLNLDGELAGQTPLSLKVLPGRLRVFA